MYGSPSYELASGSSLLNSSFSATNFSTYHDNYSKSLARGRNPKSIPRNSELWYHTKNSNDRRDKIAKGHQFWGVVDHSAESAGGDERLKTPGISLNSTDRNCQRQEHGLHREVKADSRTQRDCDLLGIGSARKNSNNVKALNSSRFDVKVCPR
jgi:hypothetical protein